MTADAAARPLGEDLADDQRLLLTSAEHRAIDLTEQLEVTLTGIVGHGAARDEDMRELRAHVHAIQAAVLSQAASRAYPQLYRLLGCAVPGDEPSP
jgi:hypothetical protein